MDELLGDFLTETAENLDLLDVELVRFEQEPNNAAMLNTIFQLVHTVKGTRGFLGPPRLAKLAHAAETLMGQYRDGAPVTAEGVTLILESIDRIKQILAELDRHGTEPAGSDADLIAALEVLADGERSPASALESAAHAPILDASDDPVLRPGEVSLAELERAWQTAPGPETDSRHPLAMGNGSADGGAKDGQARSQTVRVNVDTLERLMTTVSELVLTRNQLLELVRRSGESEFKAPLQRLSNVTAELQEGIMKARMQPDRQCLAEAATARPRAFARAREED
jgi:two-component system chemotaxis sensor kinase CheA